MPSPICASCRAPLRADAQFCLQCGQAASPMCPVCSWPVQLGAASCPSCGAAFDYAEVQLPQPQATTPTQAEPVAQIAPPELEPPPPPAEQVATPESAPLPPMAPPRPPEAAPPARSRRRLVMTVLAILLVIAAGIGVNRLLGGGNDGNNDPSPTPKGTKSVSQAEAGITALRMRDRRFHPDGIEMTKGKEFSLSLVNQDDVRHNFHFRAPGDAPFVNIVIQPNKTQGITFRAPGETGEYEFYCTFHKDDGMTGTVVVSG